jgi:hypothetical protein
MSHGPPFHAQSHIWVLRDIRNPRTPEQMLERHLPREVRQLLRDIRNPPIPQQLLERALPAPTTPKCRAKSQSLAEQIPCLV